MHKPPFAGTVVKADGIYATNVRTGLRSVYTSATTMKETGTWSSVKTPNFKKIKPRNRPKNPFSASLSLERRFKASRTNGIVIWDGYLDNDNPGTRYPDPKLESLGASSIAKAKLLGSLKSSSVNLAQAFAERKQTVDLLAKTVNRIASAAMAIRRGNLRHASNLFGLKYGGRNLRKEIPPSPQNLSNYWLEYSYGWRPLVSDIYGSCELIAKTYYERRPTIMRAQSTLSKGIVDQTLFICSTYGVREKFSGAILESTRYVVEFSEDESFAQRMAQTGLTNPLLLAWELVPYSFVVDWMLPVGTYLGNLDATIGLTFRGGTVTTRSSLQGGSSWVKFNTPAAGYSYSGGGRVFNLESKTRSILNSFPSPTLEFNPHLGVERIASGLALLTQAFKR